VDTEVILDVMEANASGSATFPETAGRLLGAGVESHFADLARGAETFYGADGTTHSEAMELECGAVAAKFSQAGLVAAIRGAQADTVRYPEFVRLATTAGVAGYWAFLTGRKVVYFGRKGEMHVEEIPGARD
jgi:uncharacterized protein YbcV (DUF1398 family)